MREDFNYGRKCRIQYLQNFRQYSPLSSANFELSDVEIFIECIIFGFL